MAIKVLRGDRAWSDDERERLLREARTIANLRSIHAGGQMGRNLFLVVLGALLFGAGFIAAAAQQKPVKGGYVIEHDADVAKQQPGPHDGGGQTIG